MKKSIFVLLLAVLLIGITACGDESKRENIMDLLEDEGINFIVKDQEYIDSLNNETDPLMKINQKIIYIANNLDQVNASRGDDNDSYTESIPTIIIFQFESDSDAEAYVNEHWKNDKDEEKNYYLENNVFVYSSDKTLIDLLED